MRGLKRRFKMRGETVKWVTDFFDYNCKSKCAHWHVNYLYSISQRSRYEPKTDVSTIIQKKTG